MTDAEPQVGGGSGLGDARERLRGVEVRVDSHEDRLNAEVTARREIGQAVHTLSVDLADVKGDVKVLKTTAETQTITLGEIKTTLEAMHNHGASANPGPQPQSRMKQAAPYAAGGGGLALAYAALELVRRFLGG